MVGVRLRHRLSSQNHVLDPYGSRRESKGPLDSDDVAFMHNDPCADQGRFVNIQPDPCLPRKYLSAMTSRFVSASQTVANAAMALHSIRTVFDFCMESSGILHWAYTLTSPEPAFLVPRSRLSATSA